MVNPQGAVSSVWLSHLSPIQGSFYLGYLFVSISQHIAYWTRFFGKIYLSYTSLAPL